MLTNIKQFKHILKHTFQIIFALKNLLEMSEIMVYEPMLFHVLRLHLT